MKDIYKIHVKPDQIVPHLNKVFDFLGYKGQKPEPSIANIVNSLIARCPDYLSSIFGFRLVSGKVVSEEEVKVENIVFHPGKIITRALSECNKFALLVATVGEKFDQWMKCKKDSGDVMEMYVADALGSVVAEATTLIGLTYISSMAESTEEKTTNSYSPGYCSWDVSQQQLFFSLLPQKFCNIVLSESSLMRPIKSTSNIIGIGKNAVKRPYGCAVCKKSDCFLKLARSKNYLVL